MAGYAELCALSNFSFLRGASHPEEYVARAAELGVSALAVADRNSLAGVVRGHVAARSLNAHAIAEADAESGGETHACMGAQRKRSVTVADVATRTSVRRKLDASDRVSVTAEGPSVADAPPWPGRFLVAVRLVCSDTPVEWVALPRDREAYGRLCRLLTLGKRRAAKGQCDLRLSDVIEGGEGMEMIALIPDPLGHPPEPPHVLCSILEQMSAVHSVSLAARPAYDGQDTERLRRYHHLAEHLGIPMLASADPLMHHAKRRPLADVLTCLREGCTIDTIGRQALPNAERRLKSPAEMARLFADFPEALRETERVTERCRFSLDELRYEYPDEISQDRVTGEAIDPQTRLEALTWQGIRERYPDGVSEAVRERVEYELRLIEKLGFARYFLTVEDLVAFARGREILVQGRGSAANSIVCYALGITAIGPDIASMVFERFVSEARNEPPDIDIDFEHERREEVIQYIYEKYGRHRAGLCATVIHFRHRAAIREVGKVMGLSQDMLSALASQIWGWGDDDVTVERLREIGLDPRDRRLRQTLRLVSEIIGFPRHLSQHVGGFVITRGRLDELCPIENAAMEDRTVIEWDKDDIDALGMLKVDVLSLGMLTCLRKAFDLIAQHGGQRYTLASLPREDPDVYEMLCQGDSIGVFQVESRAQMNFLPRMQPRKFYDLVIEVAIVRPGPIQGDMVHPYLRRRQGLEAVSYPSGELEGVLGKTLGVPLFQEQAMQIATVAAGFSPNEADQLRRALATFRKTGTIHTFRERFVAGMIHNSYEPSFAERCFDQIEGFGEYGFPESHAASFALLVYASAWVKHHHPAAFACALLNAQPMGFYAPAQIIRDARAHGVVVLPVSVNHSFWDNTLEPQSNGALALRLGFRQVKSMGEDDAAWLCMARGNGYGAVEDVWRRAGLGRRPLEALANADAFSELGILRRDALWAVKGIDHAAPLPLFAHVLEGEGREEPPPALPRQTEGEQVLEDYWSLRLTLRRHPLALLREELSPADKERNAPGVRTALQLETMAQGESVSLAGLVIVRQRPGSAKGVIFLTLEDETGSVNVVVW
ncbi:MAG: error-prone DNA polymerase, partial [Pseudomonadota bacterium]